MAKMKLGEILVSDGRIKPLELRVALSHQKSNGVRLGESLMDLGICREEELAKALAKQAGLDFIDLDRWPVQVDALKRVPFALMKNFYLYPLMVVNNELLVATSSSPDLRALDSVAFAAGMRVRPVVATVSALGRAIRRFEGALNAAKAGSKTGSNEISVDY